MKVMKNAKTTETVDPYDQFEQWLLKQPFWVQDAAWRLYNKRPIDDLQIQLYAQMCIDQIQKKAG